MMRRSVNLTILNPQYAFLEADYNNASLNQIKLDKDGTVSPNLEPSIEMSKGLKNTLIGLLIKVNPVTPILVWVPADIYCVVFLMTGEMLTF
ncbi:hypothetical protein [Ureibacillus aquaedulcis]|uniref:Uncharacterized protein n=1 Tax=Ureibacillus aquaedulcis TaxID=3058421 RepID=A0ABT8GQ87_9BACL|nr:hypothetical protein [Ureibacillus sp. BA0131]MDN4493569.1 hypothetical protein [Ureibacillus sp. BA0131]